MNWVEALGKRTRHLRERNGITAASLAKQMRLRGIGWDGSRVAAWERGEIPATIPTMYALLASLSALAGVPITLHDLLGLVGEVQLTDQLMVSADELRAMLAGQPVTEPALPESDDVRTSSDWTPADDKLARALGMSPADLLFVSQNHYGHSPSAERDRRAAPGASPQARGRIMRKVQEELQAFIDDMEPRAEGGDD